MVYIMCDKVKARASLYSFLVECRKGVSPAAAGLALSSSHRRVPSIRRDELATVLGVEADYYADLERGRLQEPIPGEIEERIAQALHLDGEYREELATRLRAVYEVSPAAPETPAQASGLHRASPGSPTPFASSPGSSASAPPSAQPAPASPQTSAAAGAAYPAARYSTPAPASPASPTSTPASETALSPAAIPTTQPVQYGISPAARAEQVAHTGQPEQAEPPFSSFTQATRTQPMAPPRSAQAFSRIGSPPGTEPWEPSSPSPARSAAQSPAPSTAQPASQPGSWSEPLSSPLSEPLPDPLSHLPGPLPEPLSTPLADPLPDPLSVPLTAPLSAPSPHSSTGASTQTLPASPAEAVPPPLSGLPDKAPSGPPSADSSAPSSASLTEVPRASGGPGAPSAPTSGASPSSLSPASSEQWSAALGSPLAASGPQTSSPAIAPVPTSHDSAHSAPRSSSGQETLPPMTAGPPAQPSTPGHSAWDQIPETSQRPHSHARAQASDAPQNPAQGPATPGPALQAQDDTWPATQTWQGSEHWPGTPPPASASPLSAPLSAQAAPAQGAAQAPVQPPPAHGPTAQHSNPRGPAAHVPAAQPQPAAPARLSARAQHSPASATRARSGPDPADSGTPAPRAFSQVTSPIEPVSLQGRAPDELRTSFAHAREPGARSLRPGAPSAPPGATGASGVPGTPGVPGTQAPASPAGSASPAPAAQIHRLAVPTAPRAQSPTPELTQFLETFDMPALLRSRTLDILAANRTATLLYAPVLQWQGGHGQHVNLLEFALVGSSAAMEFWPEWQVIVDTAISELGQVAEDHPDDPQVISTVGTLMTSSRAFGRMWSAAAPRRLANEGTEILKHPLLGVVELPYRLLYVDEDGSHVVVYAPVPGSSAHSAMKRLAGWAMAG